MPDLGGRRPSVLLAEMRQLCPAGEVDSKIFRGLFLRRLPQEIRLALAEDRLSPGLAMAARADALLAHARGNVAAAAVDSSLPVVAAATVSSRPMDRKKKTTSQPPARTATDAPRPVTGGPAPSATTTSTSGLMHTPVRPPVTGRQETKPPGAAQRRRRRAAGPHH